MSYFIGLMSGTSADGIDATLVEFKDDDSLEVITKATFDFTPALLERISFYSTQKDINIVELGTLDVQLGEAFAQAALNIAEGVDLHKVTAIGSHGQTIHHQPHGQFPFTMQLGCGATIAQKTGMNTVCDFRSNDIAAGGEGAPLAPLFHQHFFSSNKENRSIVNIGGIANLTHLPKHAESCPTGFDTGPGNTLLDTWATEQLNCAYDDNGQWASEGKLIDSVLSQLLADDYFTTPAPKSTGKEYFNLNWLRNRINVDSFSPQDIQTTLTHLTAASITQSIDQLPQSSNSIYLCGGGVKNHFLLELIQHYNPDRQVCTTNMLGVDADYVEAVAFAWLAKCRIDNIALDTTSITGANHPVRLGAVYLA